MEDRRPSLWWHASTTMRLAHTPELDTIAPLPMRRQRHAKGMDTLAGSTPVRMYRQRPPDPPWVREEPAGGAISQRCSGWTACSRRKGAGRLFPLGGVPKGPVLRPHSARQAVQVLVLFEPVPRLWRFGFRLFPPPPVATPLTGGPGPTGHRV
jgi:hypothetical protein